MPLQALASASPKLEACLNFSIFIYIYFKVNFVITEFYIRGKIP